MFSVGIRYLMGWAMAAADGANKEVAEWPPHPDRVFMALAAAWFETGQDAAEGDALRWLEGLPAPELSASQATARQLVTQYVPVNDEADPAKWDSKKGTWQIRQAIGDLPIGRARQPRSFPVAVPANADVFLIWSEALPKGIEGPLIALCGKVGAIGHSASLVQMWLLGEPPDATLVPTQGIASMRLRVFGPGRLEYLEQRHNRAAWVEYYDRQAAIIAASSKQPDLRAPAHPKRYAWDDFPDVLLLCSESTAKQHEYYSEAKAGDAQAAALLVQALVGSADVAAAHALISSVYPGGAPILASAHAYESTGVNAIPAALAELLSERLDIPFDASIVQINVVSHTGADGYGRLARQAAFDGPVESGRAYVLIDDFVGQGGTLANLRSHIIAGGGLVVGAIVLTGKPYSVTLAPTQEQLDELRKRHGKPLEKWWRKHFGHPFDYLTQSEARYLARSPDADTIRDRLAAAEQGGGGQGDARDFGSRLSLDELKARQAERFPHGAPVSLRPESALWQGYAPRTREIQSASAVSLFDPRLLVFPLRSKRPPLTATLKLTQALRGTLLAGCRDPVPEWVSGHDSAGRSSKNPHIACLPLPFVGSPHADGRLLGLALALPRGLDPDEAAQVLTRWIRTEHGLPRTIKLFAGRFFECRVELETREEPPLGLRADTWTSPSRRWASVTPVVLDRHFDGQHKREQAAESIKTACERIGLPRPAEVSLNPVSAFRGAPRGHDFPPMIRRSDGGRLHHSHVVLAFDEPVAGPVLIGAGRFRGYGLCRPLHPCNPSAMEANNNA